MGITAALLKSGAGYFFDTSYKSATIPEAIRTLATQINLPIQPYDFFQVPGPMTLSQKL